MSRIRAVVFDLDGLMVNTEDVFYASGKEHLQRYGYEMNREIMRAMVGRRPLEAFGELKRLLHFEKSAAELLEESREIFFALLDDHLQTMPGLFELLDLIDERALPRSVATSSPRPYVERVLGKFDLLGRFESMLTAEDVTHGKPHPEIYLRSAERMGVAPGELLVLEDSEAGTRSGASAGAVVVSVPHEHTREHDFSMASHVATSLADPLIRELLSA